MNSRTLFIIVVLLGLTASAASAQSKKKKAVKPKPIKVTVTVKADGPPLKPISKETDAGIWNEFELKEDGLRILLPTAKDDILDAMTGPVRSYQAATVKGTYLLVIRSVGVSVENRAINQFLEETIQNAFGDEKNKVLEKKNISYEGRSAKQIVFDLGGKRFAARLYVLNGKLFIISVSIDWKAYDKAFDKWIDKFFDSFQVKVPVVEA